MEFKLKTFEGIYKEASTISKSDFYEGVRTYIINRLKKLIKSKNKLDKRLRKYRKEKNKFTQRRILHEKILKANARIRWIKHFFNIVEEELNPKLNSEADKNGKQKANE